jgi:hypothetical protein
MADTVATNVIFEDNRQYVVHLTGVSDGTGESLVVKVDKSAIGVSTSGSEATALDIEKVDFVVTGFANVKLFWDHAADSTALILAGTGSFDFTGRQWRMLREANRTGGLQDPKTADSTGDILLTSAATSGGTYNITLWLRKRP